MKNIFLIGAGRSTVSLIQYLSELAVSEDLQITIGDLNTDYAKERIGNSPRCKAVAFDVHNDIQRVSKISDADIVISMLPAHLHVPVAKDCIALKKPMVTASYVSKEMKALDNEAKEAGVLILNEMGVDPGIDHMSAMKVIHDIKNAGGKMLQFESFTGGLVAPESDDNPWNYKFTWNPRNVVLAGAGGAVKFIQEGKYKYIPYHQLFRRTEIIEVDNYGSFEGIANRDSLAYRETYGLHDIPTLYRGTLRRPGFSRAWDVFVKLGATDDSYEVEDSENMTHREFINLFLAYNPQDSIELKLMHYLKIDADDDIMHKLKWLGIFDDKPVGLKDATPAQILEHILKQKWSMKPEDRDMIVMHHIFGYELNGEKKQIESGMVTKGKDRENTAMARTVGIPVGIGVKMVLNKTIRATGVKVPVTPDIYEPVLKELENYDIKFTEKETEFKHY